MNSYKNAVSNFAGSMRKTQDDFKTLRAQATQGGLSVVGTQVLKPPADTKDDNGKTSLYESLSEWAYDIRVAEISARDTFTAACRAISASPVAEQLRGLVYSPTLLGMAGVILSRTEDSFNLLHGLSLRGPRAFFQTSRDSEREGTRGSG